MSDQLDLFEPHAVARRSDPWTSHAAAASVDHIRQSQQHILDTLRIHGPMTDEELFPVLLARGVRMSVSGARTRRRELVDMGLVIDTGARALTKARRHSIIWGLP